MIAMQVMHTPQMPQADALACKEGRDGWVEYRGKLSIEG
jgi:hypothetical protein